jgi:hypothetical protein
MVDLQNLRCPAFLSNKRKSLLILLSAGIVARIFMTLAVPGILWSDSLLYYKAAQAALFFGDLHLHQIFHTPFYTSFLSAFLSFGETPEIGELFIMAQRFLGLLSTVLFYFIARKAFGPFVAFFSSLFFTLDTLVLYYESVVQTETLFTFFLALLLYFFLTARDENKILDYLLAGILVGFLALTRPVAQLFAFCLCLFIFLKAKNLKKAAILSSFVIIGYLGTIAPWAAYNYETAGFWGIAKGQGLNLFFRAIDIDEFAPVKERETIQTYRAYLWALNKKETSTIYFSVFDYLTTKKHFTPAEADDAMFKFAFRAVREHPLDFTLNTIQQFALLFWSARNTTDLCYGKNGPFLCCRQTRRLFRPAFPNTTTRHHRTLRNFLADIYRIGEFPIRTAIILALFGIGLFSRRNKSLSTDGYFLLLTIVYFAAMPSLFNIYDDRFRLPVEAFIFMFSSITLEWMWVLFKDILGHHFSYKPVSGSPKMI